MSKTDSGWRRAAQSKTDSGWRRAAQSKTDSGWRRAAQSKTDSGWRTFRNAPNWAKEIGQWSKLKIPPTGQKRLASGIN